MGTKRRAALVVLAGAVALAVSAGVAFAATVNCRAGTPLCVGTDGDDRLYGNDVWDRMSALQGDDLLYGRRGADTMYGDRLSTPSPSRPPDGDDRLYGNRGADYLDGLGGDDLLKGGFGDDRLAAFDYVTDDPPGRDTVLGGEGRDTVYADDGYEDTIDCGPNVDAVYYDVGLDDLADCETRNP